uniref:HDC02792 n=1 Tax=Drosophila melanogaster TaxID=7227 RepID=Q6IHB6_DROME|nr:TPA_inf: HDC02792 [Drosophila melanogaster]
MVSLAGFIFSNNISKGRSSPSAFLRQVRQREGLGGNQRRGEGVDASKVGQLLQQADVDIVAARKAEMQQGSNDCDAAAKGQRNVVRISDLRTWLLLAISFVFVWTTKAEKR